MMLMGLVTAYRVLAYYLTLALFAAGGLVVNFIAVGAFWLPRTEATERAFQRLIHRAFRLFIWWMRFIRICRVRYDENIARLPRGIVVVANHPGLMDITYLLARIPEAVCLFKPAIRRNPILGAAAGRAGYVTSSDGVDAVRSASDKVSAGSTLVIFPEGTRTPGNGEIAGLRPGFALIARRSAVAVQVLRIRCNSNVLSKRCAWWKPPQMPVEIAIELGPRFEPEPNEATAVLTDKVAAWLRQPEHGSRAESALKAFAATPQTRPC